MSLKNRIRMTPNRSPSITTTQPNANIIDPNVISSSSSSQQNSRFKIDLRALSFFSLFLFSGVANTLLVQLIYNNISFNPKSMLTNICIFLGYALLSFFKDPTKKTNNNSNNSNNNSNTSNTTISPTNSTTIQLNTSPPTSSSSSSTTTTTTTTATTAVTTKKQNFNRNKYLLLALFDCLASLLTTIGQIAVGSGLFQVLFSSKIIFAAILTKVYLKSYVSPKKWISILTIFSGLCIAVFKISSPSHQMNDTNNSYIYFGTFCVLLAAFIFSASHIFAESTIKAYDIRPYAFAAKYGIYSVIVCVVYILTVTFYNRKEWIEIPIEQTSSSDIKLVLFLFMILMITSVIRSSSMYTVLAEHGTVSMGVLYALQSIIVFFSSAFFLCDPNHPTKQNQCLSSPKLIGSLIVIFGVFMYNKANSIKQTQHIKV
ncbi:hypothetical protein RB653_006125 [Dictyostelium firmibasis]|uniref:EamA domain-containing protein n=1 Tax=Dictyostelium firmibasis TaxID=79012 RepID=A0AAN7U8G0_9MYCE